MSTIYSLGVMTGTSCDGADLALLRFEKGHERLWKAFSVEFPKTLRGRLRAAQSGKLTAGPSGILARDYSRFIGEACRRVLKRWKAPLRHTLIAVHGQTVWHAPEEAISIQLLDPSIVSVLTGCTVTAAFRQPDLARGGQGAPLVPFYHWARAVDGPFISNLPFAIHNVGGIANVTYVAREQSRVLAFDTGPGNCLIDLATERATHGRAGYDAEGKLAFQALHEIDWTRVRKLGRERYFSMKPPKTTGRELFNEDYLGKIPGHGALQVANATALTAHTMAKAYVDFILPERTEPTAVYVAGGGARNPALLSLFHRELTSLSGREIAVSVLPEDFAPAQYLEAMAFARLGYEALQGRPISLAAVTGARSNAIGAGIFPGDNFRPLLKALNLT